MGDMLADTFPALGLGFTEKRIRVRNATAGPVVPGDCLFFVASVPAILPAGVGPSYQVGAENSIIANVRTAPVAATVDGYGKMCVIDEPIEAGMIGYAYLWHPDIKVLVSDALGNFPTTFGMPLCPDGSVNDTKALSCVGGVTASAKNVAICLEEVAGPGPALVRAIFNGVLFTGRGAPA